jgi:hypothetical protein
LIHSEHLAVDGKIILEKILGTERGWLSGTALSYGLDDRGFESRQGLGIFSSPLRQDLLWGPPSLLSNGFQGFFQWR